MSTDNPTPIGAEAVKPYDAHGAKTAQVEEMFDSIAPAYDFMNTAMTFGLHRHWRNRALDMAAEALRRNGITVPAEVLDVATGTGDVAFELVHRYPEAHITGIDLSTGMLNVARRKLAEHQHTAHVDFETGDCLALRWESDTFDLITVAYGVRNFERLGQGYAEMTRVLRPGGVLCVVELSQPENRLCLAGYNIYSRHLIPLVGRLVSGDSRAYTYLPESIAAAPQRADMTALMEQAGLQQAVWKSLTFGAVTIYTATKPLSINTLR
ncbi:MAG: bifunctional demethylmenaquinone methyltransferase/2-methoxy-6-polyprenyl-1,4-benzoquinol methylase UbiE [Muribaculaceae bacterium]|nr:bifunctional demethylmenaquinone methyltransferase/2-methoxy-6-polyprenyl-1,4-benzoquinol methylase UbiE [Muribaculaceae bacterium]